MPPEMGYTDGMDNFYHAVYRVVRDVPAGKVVTYGQVATLLGSPRAARAVGYALRACTAEDQVPWQRVINAQGGISARGDVERPMEQRLLLEEEGVVFEADNTCDLRSYRWEPDHPEQYQVDVMPDIPFR